jgi:CBS domain-containing protein
MMNEPVSKIMTRDLITVSPEDTLDKARALFAEKRFHHLLVVEKDLLKGLITTSDLLWLDEPSSNYKNIKISDVMTRKLATLEPTDKIGSAAQIFLRNWFHALPVVNSDGKIEGIVTTFDVLHYSFKKEYPGEEI